MSLTGKATTDRVLRGRINRLDTLCMSAYGIAVKNGFEGTEEEWLASLKGEKGDTGTVDENGLVLKDQATGEKYKLYVTDGKLTMTESEG